MKTPVTVLSDMLRATATQSTHRESVKPLNAPAAKRPAAGWPDQWKQKTDRNGTQNPVNEQKTRSDI